MGHMKQIFIENQEAGINNIADDVDSGFLFDIEVKAINAINKEVESVFIEAEFTPIIEGDLDGDSFYMPVYTMEFMPAGIDDNGEALINTKFRAVYDLSFENGDLKISKFYENAQGESTKMELVKVNPTFNNLAELFKNAKRTACHE